MPGVVRLPQGPQTPGAISTSIVLLLPWANASSGNSNTPMASRNAAPAL
jgi:hypothetical protein